MSRWIPVSERLPVEGTAVIGWFNEWVAPVVVYFNAEDGWIEDADPIGFEPTHWMPLPEPPEALCDPKK